MPFVLFWREKGITTTTASTSCDELFIVLRSKSLRCVLPGSQPLKSTFSHPETLACNPIAAKTNTGLRTPLKIR